MELSAKFKLTLFHSVPDVGGNMTVSSVPIGIVLFSAEFFGIMSLLFIIHSDLHELLFFFA